MPLIDVAPLEASVEIAAPPARVWALLADLRNVPRWSPQVRKTIIRGGVMSVGAKMFNINRRGLLVWPTRATVTDYEPERRVAFRVHENWTVWSFELEPTESGTRLVQRREAPRGISDFSVRATERLMGGVAAFTQEMQLGMEQTLNRIRTEAERDGSARRQGARGSHLFSFRALPTMLSSMTSLMARSSGGSEEGPESTPTRGSQHATRTNVLVGEKWPWIMRGSRPRRYG